MKQHFYQKEFYIIRLKMALLLAVFFAFNAQGQIRSQLQWQKKSENKNATFYQVQQNFRDYWSGRVRGKGQGYGVFKRWENFMAPRVFPSGNMNLPSTSYANFMRWNRTSTTATTNSQSRLAATGNWTELGPFSKPTGYDAGVGRVDFIKFNPTNNNIAYVSTPDGGLWKTTNVSAALPTWTTNADFLPVIGCSELAIAPDGNTMYLATGSWEADKRSAGVLKSTDGGTTWNTTSLTFTAIDNYFIRRLQMDPTNPLIMLAATDGGIFRTTDGWATNSLTSLDGSYNIQDVKFKPTDHNTLYAAGRTGLNTSVFYKSTDNGVTWATITTGLPLSSDVSRIILAVAPGNANYVYALAGNSAGGYKGLYRSTNSGNSFTTQSTTPNILNTNIPEDGPGGQAGHDLAISVSPVNSDLVTIGGISQWRSTDGGVTWNLLTFWFGTDPLNPGGNRPEPYIHADVQSIQYLPGSSTTLYTSSDGGIYRSTNNGVSWTDISNNLRIAQETDVANSATAAGLIVAGLQDIGSVKTTNGVSAYVGGGDGESAFIDRTNDQNIVISDPNGQHSVTTDGGVSFTSLNGNGLPPGTEFFSPILQDPTTATTCYAAGRPDLYKSTDFLAAPSHSWTSIGTPSGTGSIFRFVIYPANAQIIYTLKQDAVSKTINGGTTWTNVTGTLPVGNASIRNITISNTDPNKVWVVFSGYSAGDKVYKTIDGGVTWTDVNSTGLPNIPINTIVYRNNSVNDEVYIGADIGVYVIDNTAATWAPFFTGLARTIVNDLEIFYPTGKIRAATYGRGSWESDLNTVTLPNLTITDVTQVEGNSATSAFTFTVNLSAPAPAGGVTFNVATSNGTATAGTDYVALNTTGSIAAGSSSTTVAVTVNGDLIFENNETFTVNITSPVNAVITDGQGTGTITNDDGAPLPNLTITDVTQNEGNSGTTSFTFTVNLSTPALAGAVTFNVATANGTATSGSDYVALNTTGSIPVGSSSTTVVVTVNGDVTFEGNETFTVNITNATNAVITDGQGIGTITNDDPLPNLTITDVTQVEGNSATSAFTFTVSLSSPAPAGGVSFNVATANGTATAGSDYVALTTAGSIAAGSTSTTVIVNVNGDVIFEGNETFMVNITNATNAVVTDAQGVGTITNDDPLPNLTITDVTQAEGNSGTSAFIFTVNLSAPAPAGGVTFNVATANNTAVAPGDYTAKSLTAQTIQAGSSTYSFTVLVNGDATAESTETFFVNVSNATNAVITDAQGVGTITTDDADPCSMDVTPPVITSKNITINLDATGNATIQPADVIVSATDNCTLDSSSFTVTPNSFSCSGSAGSANHQAYVANTNTGNQAWTGELGMEFKVNRAGGIVVKQLGAFDHQGNGITGTQSGGIRVAIFNKATQSIVAGLETVITGNADSYLGNHRLKNITPVTLLPGDYVIVSKGYNTTELNGNVSFGNITPTPGDEGNGAISFTGSSRFGTPNTATFSYPQNGDGGPTNRYLAGTFVYDVAATADTGSTNHQAYVANTTTGNQSWAGELGMEFRVNQGSGIIVKQLGTFDHQGNGITGTQSGGIRVAIFNKATQSIVAGLETVITGNADSYTGNHRMKNVTPVTLMPGDYVIVSKGYNNNERNGNSGFAGVTPVPGDISNGAISYTGTGLYGNPHSATFSYPQNGDGGPANRYLAGTFVYDVPGTTGGGVGNNSVVISVKDAAGNIGYATATVTVTDANGVCNKPSVSMAPKTVVNPTLVGAMRIEEIKVYPNPSTGAFTVSLSNLQGAEATLQVMYGNGKLIEQKRVPLSSKIPSQRVTFNLVNQPTGVYFVKLISKQGIQTAKVVIQR